MIGIVTGERVARLPMPVAPRRRGETAALVIVVVVAVTA